MVSRMRCSLCYSDSRNTAMRTSAERETGDAVDGERTQPDIQSNLSTFRAKDWVSFFGSRLSPSLALSHVCLIS